MSKAQKILLVILLVVILVPTCIVMGFRAKVHRDIVTNGQIVDIMWLNDKYHVMPNTKKHVSQDAIIVTSGSYYGFTVSRINVDRYAVHPHGAKTSGYVYEGKFVLLEEADNFFTFSYVEYFSYNEKYL